MTAPRLALDQAPPLSVPMRFFLTAPIFGMAAGLLLALAPGMLANRWIPQLLAATHVLLLGFVVMIILGALQQVLPVVAGAPILAARVTGAIIHVAWTAGVALLASGLGLGRGSLAGVGGLLLLIGALAHLIAAARLVTSKVRGETITALRLVHLSFALAVGLGVFAAAGHAALVPLTRPNLANIHLAWALLGVVTALFMGLSWRIVPMLLMTQPYPRWLRVGGVPSLLLLLLAWTLAPNPALRLGAAILIGGLLCTHALVTVSLLARRGRSVADPTVRLFEVAMIALVAAACVHLYDEVFTPPDARIAVAAGLLHVMGFVSVVVVAMLLKIVPFMTFFHLQAQVGHAMAEGRPIRPVPLMKDLIGDSRARAIAVLHVSACLLVILAPFGPPLVARVAGLGLAASFALLLVTLVSVARRG